MGALSRPNQLASRSGGDLHMVRYFSFFFSKASSPEGHFGTNVFIYVSFISLLLVPTYVSIGYSLKDVSGTGLAGYVDCGRSFSYGEAMSG